MATVAPPKIETSEFKEIYVRDEYSAWCRLLWQDQGRVIILSDYGHWSFFWGHRGDYTVEAFLAKLDMHYMGGKMLGATLEEYSVDSTVQCIRESIIELRKDTTFNREQAREEWKLADDLDSGDIDFRDWGQQTNFEDWYEFSRSEVVTEWKMFWERLWRPLIKPILDECA